MNEQRRLALLAERARLEVERAGFESELVVASADTMRAISEHIARRERRIDEIDAELAGGEQEAATRRAVDLLGQWAGDIRRDVTRLDRRLDEHQRHIDETFDDLRDLIRANWNSRASAMRVVYWWLGLLTFATAVIAYMHVVMS